MVHVVNSFSIPESANGEVERKAKEMAIKTAKYLREKWPEHDCQLTRSLMGEEARIHFTWRFASLGESEQFWPVYAADSGVKSLGDEWIAAATKLGGPLLVRKTNSYYKDLG
jgi:hypothetical protein